MTIPLQRFGEGPSMRLVIINNFTALAPGLMVAPVEAPASRLQRGGRHKEEALLGCWKWRIRVAQASFSLQEDEAKVRPWPSVGPSRILEFREGRDVGNPLPFLS